MSSNCDEAGILYYQVIHDREVRLVSAGYRIFSCEWDRKHGRIVVSPVCSDIRSGELECIRENVRCGLDRMRDIADVLEASGMPYSAEDIVCRYNETAADVITVFGFIRRKAARLRRMGRNRTAGTYMEALSSLMKFRGYVDFRFNSFDADMIERYEAWMRMRRLCRNTTSFYMRILRTLYNQAVSEGLAREVNPFRNVYTGIDKTAKRAVTLQEIRRIKELDLSGEKGLEFARDIFLLSFCLRGMSFVDLAYLRKTDLSNGFVTYNRRKTGRQLTIRWERHMQLLLDKYNSPDTRYLLPIIVREDGTEERQYRNRMLLINRRLKKVAALAGVHMPLTLYVARHSWASIANAKNIPISVISGAMWHDSESTTQIYLASIQTNTIDEANQSILKDL